MSTTKRLDAFGGEWFNDHKEAPKFDLILKDFTIHEPIVWGQRHVSAMGGQMTVDLWITDPGLTEGADDCVCELEVRWLDRYGKLHIVRPGFRVFLDELDSLAQNLAKAEYVDTLVVEGAIRKLSNPEYVE